MIHDDSDVVLPCELKSLAKLLDSQPETLATGNAEISVVALNAAKFIFDLSVQSEEISRPHVVDLVSSLASSQAPQTRSKAKAEANKPEDTNPPSFDPAPLNALFIDGMDDEQIWAQVDFRTQTICRMLDYVLQGEVDESGDGSEESENDGETLRKALEALQADDEIDIEAFLEQYGLDDRDSQDDDSEEGSSSSCNVDEDLENISPLRDPSSDEESDFYEVHVSPKKKRKFGEISDLDDGFFDLEEFNAYTDRAEAKSSSRGRLAGSDSDEEDAIDLFAGVNFTTSAEDKDNAGEIFYGDFFQPPSNILKAKPSGKRKSNNDTQVRFHQDVRVKQIKATGKNRSLHDDDLGDDDEYMLDEKDDSEERGSPDQINGGSDCSHNSLQSDEDMEEGPSATSDDGFGEWTAIQRFKHDLFAEEEEKGNGDLTSHEKRMQSLREQILKLESENVAVKEWMLMGEADSRQRPQNSLLEEDIEFDRVRKVAPVITEEAVQTLEEKIKARIVEGRFDDVVRRRPAEDKPFLPSKLLELKDTKSKESLAQIYEAEYLASHADGPHSDDRDGRLRKEHDEITLLWERISNKLDALCNAHYVPKQPKAIITTVTNAPTVMMESALPTSNPVTSLLAPQEVFASSAASLRAKSELTPAEKRSRRNKERKAKKRVNKFVKVVNGVEKSQKKAAALDSLVKHGKGVTIVGKKDMSQSKSKYGRNRGLRTPPASS